MKILFLGIGNIMFSDEGLGVYFCKLMEQKYTFHSADHSIDFVDGGTLANKLTPIIAQYDYMIMSDCVDADGSEVGDVYFFDFENVPENISFQGSAHEVEMLQTLSMMDLLGDRPKTKIISAVPKVVEVPTFNLTAPIRKAAVIMEKVIIKHLEELGFKIEQKNELDIQKIADEFAICFCQNNRQ